MSLGCYATGKEASFGVPVERESTPCHLNAVGRLNTVGHFKEVGRFRAMGSPEGLPCQRVGGASLLGWFLSIVHPGQCQFYW